MVVWDNVGLLWKGNKGVTRYLVGAGDGIERPHICRNAQIKCHYWRGELHEFVYIFSQRTCFIVRCLNWFSMIWSPYNMVQHLLRILLSDAYKWYEVKFDLHMLRVHPLKQHNLSCDSNGIRCVRFPCGVQHIQWWTKKEGYEKQFEDGNFSAKFSVYK